MKATETPAAARRRLQVSMLAAHANLRIKKALAATARERANLANKRLAAALADQHAAREHYQTLTQDYSRAALADVTPERHPYAPSPPIDTYEGSSTYETFMLLHTIDNHEPLYNDKLKRFDVVLRSRHHAEQNRKNGHTEHEMIRDIWQHLDANGHATPEAIDLYAGLIAAALETLRKLRAGIDLARVDLDDLITTLADDLEEYAESWTYPETAP